MGPDVTGDVTPVPNSGGETGRRPVQSIRAPDRKESQLTLPVPVTETKSAFGVAF